MTDNEFKVEGLTVRIEQDESPMNPREEFDNLSRMICFHRRYDIGDKHELNSNMFTCWDDVKRYLIRKEHAVVMLPLYLLDHSGLWIDTKPFACDPQGWDSGVVGFVFVSRDDLLKELKGKRISKKRIEYAAKVMRQEVETYNQYLTGEVYGFIIQDQDGNTLDSCWGFYGDIEYVKQEATNLVKGYVEEVV